MSGQKRVIRPNGTAFSFEMGPYLGRSSRCVRVEEKHLNRRHQGLDLAALLAGLTALFDAGQELEGRGRRDGAIIGWQRGETGDDLLDSAQHVNAGVRVEEVLHGLLFAIVERRRCRHLPLIRTLERRIIDAYLLEEAARPSTLRDWLEHNCAPCPPDRDFVGVETEFSGEADRLRSVISEDLCAFHGGYSIYGMCGGCKEWESLQEGASEVSFDYFQPNIINEK